MSEAAFEPIGIMAPKVFGIPVDQEILFSNHKEAYKKRIEKRQRKLIVKIPYIKPFLRKGEKILLITTGYSPLASLAQYLTGFIFIYLKRSLFIFTNYRIFHVPCTPSYKFKNSIAQVAYTGCQSIMLKGGTLTVKYVKYGKVEKFKGIAAPERKKIRALLKKTIPLTGTKRQLTHRVHLCPRCRHPLAVAVYTCANCQLGFKSRVAATIRAILIPGGGYFYNRHYLIGFLSALSEIFLMFFLVIIVKDIVDGTQISPMHLVALPLVLLFIKTATVVHSTHFIAEFIPKDKKMGRLKEPPQKMDAG
ncbi:MAG: hypothetical protein PVJ22_14305 [Desulfobacterales bacterium]